MKENTKIEKRFVKWAKSHANEWWENGEGHINILDFRIMLDFWRPYIRQTVKEAEKAGYNSGFVDGVKAQQDVAVKEWEADKKTV